MNPLNPPEWSRVGFTDPIMRVNPRTAELARQWLKGYQAGHSGAINSVAVTTLETPEESAKIEIWVEVANMSEHITAIINGVREVLESEARESGMVLVPKSLIDQFSKPLDFRITKC